MKIYLAGPMTGIPQHNFPRFHEAAALLRAHRLTVVNPAELNTDPATRWADCMRKDIAELLACDAIVLLEDWARSRGALLELHIAIELGLHVFTIDEALSRLHGDHWALAKRSNNPMEAL